LALYNDRLEDPTYMNLFYNQDGVGLIQIDDETVVFEMHVELVRDV
jgi:hypothetical protein